MRLNYSNKMDVENCNISNDDVNIRNGSVFLREEIGDSETDPDNPQQISLARSISEVN